MRYFFFLFLCSFSLCFSLQAAPVSHDSVYWQIILKYTETGITLERVSRMPPLSKAVRSPGVLGRPVTVPYVLAWQDEAGNTLFSSEAVIPLGIRIPPGGTGKPDIMTESGYCVIRISGPADADSIANISLARKDVPQIPDSVHIPPAFTVPAIDLPLTEAALHGVEHMTVEGPVGVRKAVDTGDDGNRLVMVVLGDGYTAADLAAGEFSNDVETLITAFQSTPPWGMFLEGANIYAIDVESNEQGADYEDASPDNGGTLKDTYFNSSFWCSNIERLLCITGDGYSKAYTAANNYVGAGVWDEIIVLVNSTKYGGSGGAIAVSSVNSAAPGVILHEFGHSFGHLADEYDYGGSGHYSGSDPGNPNVDIHTNYVDIKWNIWIEDGTPLPTPDTAVYDNTVGAFEGAYYHETGIYRPWRCCMMRALHCGFCPVCTEAMALEYFDMVNLADNTIPSPGSVVNSVDSNAVIRIEPLPVSGLTYTWKADGVTQTSVTGPAFTCHAGLFSSYTGTVEVTIAFPSAMIRQTMVDETYQWTVIIPEPALLLPFAVLCLCLRMRSN
jgi:hypothetical protein